MSDCVLDIGDHSHSHAQPQILLEPVLLGRGRNLQSASEAASFSIATHFDTDFNELLDDAGHIFRSDAFMHQQLFGGIANGRTMRLGVDDDAVRHIEIGRLVHEDVAIPCSSLDHRHRGIFGDECDEPGAAARNDDVNQAAGCNQLMHRLPRARIEQFDGPLGQAGNRSHNLNQALAAPRGFSAAAENDGVPGLEREHRGIDGHVRPRLVNDSYHPQRHTHFADAQPIRLGPFRHGVADWIGQNRHLAHPARHGFDPRRSQRQAVAHGAFETGILHVLPVRIQDAFLVRFDRIRNRQQQRVFCFRGQQRQLGGRGSCPQQSLLRRGVGDRSSSHGLVYLTFCDGK